ncbi:hypothetical protein COY95_04920 [Candidatus Woesearchaeota archaeon CG_4_10_14_0_8_um_filter_47_5]|nr:MAG: hypothetical protein COY95_04920 [Candidatus Woesearchaeota archaeon CG_4_10_14_0_8_um_filter_47_5]
MPSSMRSGVDFLGEVGLYDVVLPFLLVFIIVFAILEKSKVFGYVEISGQRYTRKNLNAMAAFVIGFFVVASARLVQIITQVSSQVVIFLVGIFLLLMLYGALQKESADGVEFDGWVKNLLFIVSFIGLIFIFLNAIPSCDGTTCSTWLEIIISFVKNNWSSGVVSSILMFAITLGIIFYVTSYKTGTSQH